MNQWAFVIAAYGLVGSATVGLIGWSLLSMSLVRRCSTLGLLREDSWTVF